MIKYKLSLKNDFALSRQYNNKIKFLLPLQFCRLVKVKMIKNEQEHKF